MTPVTGGGVSLGALGPGLPPTLLAPARYAEIMGIKLTHFMQLAGTKAPLTGGCDDVWDQTAREDLCWTIQQAEEMIARELGFWPAPKFITNERIQCNLPGIRDDWRNAELKTEWAYIDNFGTESLSLVQSGATVQYSNNDNDPLDREETATIGTALYADLSACSAACDVAVFFRTADGAIDAADPRFEIRPLSVDIEADGTMHITGESSLFINPTLWTLTKLDCEGSDDPHAWRWSFDTTNLVSQVDVYCRSVSLVTPVSMLWDSACHCTDCGVCQHASQVGCAYCTDKRRGYFAPRTATWNGSTNVDATPSYTGAPEIVNVNYRAGYPLDATTCRINAQLERAIVKLTNALLPEPPCGYCDDAEVRWKRDRTDVDPLTPEAASMPWDLYKQGALEAWRIVKRFAMGRGGKMGRGNR